MCKSTQICWVIRCLRGMWLMIAKAIGLTLAAWIQSPPPVWSHCWSGWEIGSPAMDTLLLAKDWCWFQSARADSLNRAWNRIQSVRMSKLCEKSWARLRQLPLLPSFWLQAEFPVWNWLLVSFRTSPSNFDTPQSLLCCLFKICHSR